MFESRRRTITKSIIWRFIGILWTWAGAYIIITILPSKYKTAINIASLVTLWHHSTRMIMYYIYERIWSKVKWGRQTEQNVEKPISFFSKTIWTVFTILSVLVILWLLINVTPSIKKNQKDLIDKPIDETPTLSK